MCGMCITFPLFCFVCIYHKGFVHIFGISNSVNHILLQYVNDREQLNVPLREAMVSTMCVGFSRGYLASTRNLETPRVYGLNPCYLLHTLNPRTYS